MFEPGKSGNPAGRPKGAQNKTTLAAKQAFQNAFDDLGGVQALVTWATDNPTEFYRQYSKLIPQDVNASVEGLTIQIVKHSDVA